MTRVCLVLKHLDEVRVEFVTEVACGDNYRDAGPLLGL